MFAGGVVCQRGPQGTGKGEKVVVVGRTGWCALLVVVLGVGGDDNKSGAVRLLLPLSFGLLFGQMEWPQNPRLSALTAPEKLSIEEDFYKDR